MKLPQKTRYDLIALVVGAATMIGGLLNLKKKQNTEKAKEGEEPPKAEFSTAAGIITGLGAAAFGWGVYMLVTAGKSQQAQLG